MVYCNTREAQSLPVSPNLMGPTGIPKVPFLFQSKRIQAEELAEDNRATPKEATRIIRSESRLTGQSQVSVIEFPNRRSVATPSAEIAVTIAKRPKAQKSGSSTTHPRRVIRCSIGHRCRSYPSGRAPLGSNQRCFRLVRTSASAIARAAAHSCMCKSIPKGRVWRRHQVKPNKKSS